MNPLGGGARNFIVTGNPPASNVPPVREVASHKQRFKDSMRLRKREVGVEVSPVTKCASCWSYPWSMVDEFSQPGRFYRYTRASRVRGASRPVIFRSLPDAR